MNAELMRHFTRIVEGGWDDKLTQNTVITPSIVKAALKVAQQFVDDFNSYLETKGIQPIRLGSPTGSSAYHDVDPEDKVYGDMDLQIVVPEIPELEGQTYAAQSTFWFNMEDEFVQAVKPAYVAPESKAGHPLLKIGDDQFVQVDLMPHTERLSTWGRTRVTPEHGVKGMLSGNMYSVLGSLLDMSIQHSGAQIKVRDGQRVSFAQRKDTQLQTITTNIETFVLDIFRYEAQDILGTEDVKIDPLLQQFPGVNPKQVKISDMVNAVKGFARSCEANGMFGQGSLKNYTGADEFVNKFVTTYEQKAMADINGSKRSKAETPSAIERAKKDVESIRSGLAMVKDLFAADELNEGLARLVTLAGIGGLRI